MVLQFFDLFLMLIIDNSVGLGINLIYFNETHNLQFMLKVLNLKIVIGRLKEA